MQLGDLQEGDCAEILDFVRWETFSERDQSRPAA